MRHSRLVFIVVLMLIAAACSPAATPAPAPVAATSAPAAPAAPKPTTAPFQPPPAAAPPTAAPQATQGLPELRPPVSGGLLNPPTPIPTTPGTQPDTANLNNWQVYHDANLGLTFKYPPDWRPTARWYFPGTIGIVERVEVNPLDQSTGNSSQILIDVRTSRGDLLSWLKGQLPTGSLMIGQADMEGNVDSYNAQLSSYPAVFVYAPEHGSGTSNMAQIHAGDDQYFYQFTYIGGIPDNVSQRAIYLQLLGTVSLTRSVTSGLTLPTTAFTTGVTP